MFNVNLDFNKLLSSFWKTITFPIHFLIQTIKNKKNKKQKKQNYLFYWFYGLKDNEQTLINNLIKHPQHQIVYSYKEDPLNLINQSEHYEKLSQTFINCWLNNAITLTSINKLEKIGEYQQFYKYTLNFYPHPKKIKIIKIKNKQA